MEAIKSQLKNYICETLIGIDVQELADGDSLFKDKRLDSLNMGELLSFIETTFKIEITPLEITFENFDSINELTHFIQRKATDVTV